MVTDVEPLFGRFLFSGISYGELAAALARWQASNSWYEAWVRGAERLANQAIIAEEDERWVTAVRCWLEASAMYHFAQFHLFDDTPAKRLAQDLSGSAYRRIAASLLPSCELLTFTVDGTSYSGYFRAAQQDTTGPCVILLNGLDSVKEVELHQWSEVLVRYGISTFAFDGPGQGKSWRARQMTGDFERVVVAAISALAGDPRVDPARLGVFGVSFGGYLACRATARDQRIRAAVDLAGPYDYLFLDEARASLQQNFCYAFGVRTVNDLYARVNREGLRALPAPACPLLVIHGRQDKSIPYNHAERIWTWARGAAELHTFADGDHVCTNRFNEVTALVADWFLSQLADKEADPFPLHRNPAVWDPVVPNGRQIGRGAWR